MTERKFSTVRKLETTARRFAGFGSHSNENEHLGGKALTALIASVLTFALLATCVFVPQNEENARGKTAYAYSGSGSILIEQSTGRVLCGENEGARLYPASTTKILTALTVIDNVPTDRVVTVPSQAVGIEGSSVYLKEGEKLTVLELLYAMLLRSGNDAATALALAVSDSAESFASLMNEKAAECGAVNSHFVNPHGLHDEEHYTTAYDLALITARAFENPLFRRLASSKTAVIGSEESCRYLVNKNKMLKLYDGANGVKTGYTKRSGRCLVSAARRNGMQLIAVVLNCPNMWEESERLLDFGFENFSMQPLAGSEFAKGGSEIAVSASYSRDGEFIPRAYPVLNGGRERIKIILGANR